jgi:hypothetical protein
LNDDARLENERENAKKLRQKLSGMDSMGSSTGGGGTKYEGFGSGIINQLGEFLMTAKALLLT